jgi:hypothetical protein
LTILQAAARWDCGIPGDYICPCTKPLSALEVNITNYQNWNIAGTCTTEDVHIDGIFFDEVPYDGNCTAYMANATAFAKSTLTRGNTVLFNAGQGNFQGENVHISSLANQWHSEHSLHIAQIK